MRDKVGFVLEFQRKKNELSIKGKKKLRSEEISHIARPKKGYHACQLLTEMLTSILMH